MKEKLHFSRELARLMEARGIKPAQLAKRIKVSHVAVGNFLKGQHPKSEHLHSLAKFFNVTMEELLNGREEPPGALVKARIQESSSKTESLIGVLHRTARGLRELADDIDKALKKY